VKVGLILGPWFHALGYIIEASDPLQGEFIQSIIIITFKRKARVFGREVSLEWMSSQLPS
jgi:hypothetical protein